MAISWEEEFWLITSILNMVLGVHLSLRKLFSSWSPALPIFAAVTVDLYHRLDSFSCKRRHKNYFATKSKIFESFCLEIIVVSLSESMFPHGGYKWVALFPCLAYGIPFVWAMLRRPCLIPPEPETYTRLLDMGGFMLSWFLYWNDHFGYMSEVFVGSCLLRQSRELNIYHLYLEADRIMHNPNYYDWLLQQIRSDATYRNQMLADLFLTRGVYLPG